MGFLSKTSKYPCGETVLLNTESCGLVRGRVSAVEMSESNDDEFRYSIKLNEKDYYGELSGKTYVDIEEGFVFYGGNFDVCRASEPLGI
jgi:hypothetical protein